ncbi:Tyrosine-protein phosphatase precursor [Arthrobacter saudimassiliensis]|uniref:Tyrosine-protein phosphatase n=1 Tax=Arthrobacter saudimassiliensis TaxID=1461584 RepID=A0A078MRX3_9MICC|nr:Tyrosine-protein phosphatase precursor [Arthrobacter saudimassiliensis]
MDAAERAVHWDGAVNARDLGGLPVAGGRRVRPGRLIRMGRAEWLTEQGWRQAWEDGVRTVIDLRNEQEQGRRDTDPEVPDAVQARFRRLSLPIQDWQDPDFTALTGPYMDSPRFYRENLRRWPRRLAAVTEAIAEAPDGGVVFHCSAGRDRTGLVAMLLLQLAGAAPETIAADYVQGLCGINAHHARQRTPRERPLTPAELHDRAEAERAALLAALEGFDAEGYLRSAGVRPRVPDRLRGRMLDPDPHHGPDAGRQRQRTRGRLSSEHS